MVSKNKFKKRLNKVSRKEQERIAKDQERIENIMSVVIIGLLVATVILLFIYV